MQVVKGKAACPLQPVCWCGRSDWDYSEGKWHNGNSSGLWKWASLIGNIPPYCPAWWPWGLFLLREPERFPVRIVYKERKVLNLTLGCFSFWVLVRGPDVIYTQINLISMWYSWALPLLRMLLNCLPYKLGICIHICIYSTAMRANVKLNWEDSASAKQVLINHWQAEYNWLKFKYTYLRNVISFKNGPKNKSLVSEPLFSWV